MVLVPRYPKKYRILPRRDNWPPVWEPLLYIYGAWASLKTVISWLGFKTRQCFRVTLQETNDVKVNFEGYYTLQIALQKHAYLLHFAGPVCLLYLKPACKPGSFVLVPTNKTNELPESNLRDIACRRLHPAHLSTSFLSKFYPMNSTTLNLERIQ